MSDKHLIVEGLSIEFDGQTVVHNLSFTLAPGKTLALVESSLLNMMTGMWRNNSFCLIHSRKSSPLMPGIRMSVIIRSGVFPSWSHLTPCNPSGSQVQS